MLFPFNQLLLRYNVKEQVREETRLKLRLVRKNLTPDATLKINLIWE